MEKRAFVDRRQGERRKGYDLDVMNRLGIERRANERRIQMEKRQDWLRVAQWSSIKLSDIDIPDPCFQLHL